VGVRGLYELLRQPGEVPRRVKDVRSFVEEGREEDRRSRGQRGTPLISASDASTSRTLFTDFYQRGRGFSTDDLIRVINRITRRSYEGFFSRYVSGTDVPPSETIFSYAGYQVERTTRKFPNLGVNLDQRGRVTGVHDRSDAGTISLQQVDFILSIDGQALDGQPGGAVFRLLNEKAGQNTRLRIRRGGEERNWKSPSRPSNSSTIASLIARRRCRNS
jgi:predicted metalloprotease with PDZ domain